MATRATIRFATREEGVPFDKHPESWHAQFYNHWDGYPEGLGVEIAESFTKYRKVEGWEVEALDIPGLVFFFEQLHFQDYVIVKYLKRLEFHLIYSSKRNFHDKIFSLK